MRMAQSVLATSVREGRSGRTYSPPDPCEGWERENPAAALGGSYNDRRGEQLSLSAHPSYLGTMRDGQLDIRGTQTWSRGVRSEVRSEGRSGCCSKMGAQGSDMDTNIGATKADVREAADADGPAYVRWHPRSSNSGP